MVPPSSTSFHIHCERRIKSLSFLAELETLATDMFCSALRRSLLFLALNVYDCTQMGGLCIFTFSQARCQVEEEKNDLHVFLYLDGKQGRGNFSFSVPKRDIVA